MDQTITTNDFQQKIFSKYKTAYGNFCS